MQCPFCGTEMIRGELKSRGGNYFLPEGHKEPRLYTKSSMEKVGAFMLPPGPLDISLNPHFHFPTAYWCNMCNKLLIDCEQ